MKYKDILERSPAQNLETSSILNSASAVLQAEADALLTLKSMLDDSFVSACSLLKNIQGRVIVLGMGKSGHIGCKIAATLASTGTPSFFVHPAEASHGDMGMITSQDAILAISYSGKTEEILRLIPFVKRLQIPLIAMTGNPQSGLAQAADIHLHIPVTQEACPLGLAPTTSTTACLALGDALAIALLTERGFTHHDFALVHPAGSLGRQLLLRVDDIMHQGADLPFTTAETPIAEALVEMSAKKLGMIAIVDSKMRVLGVFTDGDLRRALTAGYSLHETPLSKCMTTPCMTLPAGTLAATALNTMEQKRINGFLVTDADGKLIGAFNTQDLIRAQVL